MTTPAPKPPKAPRRAGFGSFATSTAPVAAAPATDTTTDPADTAPQQAPAPEPAQPAAPDPAPASGREQTHPDPDGRQLARPSDLFGDAGGGNDFMDALLAGPPVDPMLDLVPLGGMVPRHYKRALDNVAFVSGRRKQDLIQQALGEFLGEELLAKSLRRR